MGGRGGRKNGWKGRYAARIWRIGCPMMNSVWAAMCCAGLVWGLASGRAAALGQAALASGMEAVSLSIRLAGGFALWCGALQVLEEAGAAGAFARALAPLLKRLFPALGEDSPARAAIAENFAANMLGLGNAATPAGLRAMRLLREEERAGDAATDAMCMFLVLNASSLQLFPSTVIALRAAAGAESPASIVLPTLCATAVSTLTGGLACAALARRGGR